MKTNRLVLWAAAVALVVGFPQSASAYAGPGAGLTVIGAALAFVGSIFLAIVGFIWYPIKRLLRGRLVRRQKTSNRAADGLTQ